MPRKSLEDIVSETSPEYKKEKKRFNLAYWLSDAGEWLGSLLGAYATHKLTGSKYLAASVGNIGGGLIGEELGWNVPWYLSHKERYKGLKGKWKYLKDYANFTVKELPLDIASYALDIPLALAGTALTGNPVAGTAIGGLASELLYWLGYKRIMKSKLKKIAAEEKSNPSNAVSLDKYRKNPAYSAKENYGPGEPYKNAD